MGLFSGGSGSWHDEFDRRVDDPSVKKDTMRSWRLGGSETRVADDDGVLRRRNGSVCCGCGKAGAGDAAHDTPSLHGGSHHGDDHHDDDGSSGLFLGIF